MNYLALSYLWIMLLICFIVSPRIEGKGRVGLVAVALGLITGIIGWLK